MWGTEYTTVVAHDPEEFREAVEQHKTKGWFEIRNGMEEHTVGAYTVYAMRMGRSKPAPWVHWWRHFWFRRTWRKR